MSHLLFGELKEALGKTGKSAPGKDGIYVMERRVVDQVASNGN